MRVLVLGGAGDIGSSIVETLCSMDVDSIVIGDVNITRARGVVEVLRSKHCNVELYKVDATNLSSLSEVSRGVDVVINSVGPFYKFGYAIAKNMISLGLNFVDICDDYDAIMNILNLNEEAERKGILGISGLGWTPGLSNILALQGTRKLGAIEGIDIYWVGSAADSKGLAVVMHLFHALIGEVPMYINGSLTYVTAGSGEVLVEFPEPIGKLKLYYTGHPEPITIPRVIPSVRRVTVRGGLVPAWQNSFAKFLLRVFNVNSDVKAERLSRIIHRIEGIFRVGGLQLSGLRVDVEGYTGKITYIAMDRMRRLTGIPAALGAIKIARGELKTVGVKPPEAVIRDPESFIEDVRRLGIKIVEMSFGG